MAFPDGLHQNFGAGDPQAQLLAEEMVMAPVARE